ncbi:Peptidoglycan-binding domain 1 protein [Alloactinosynnema sp. L-07]|uniref:peptidoglycan-binding domain-containing protein n=1 Tax=Alloactinosynnema sp. L-07 TaxID=1653480 RepID=UPI00065EF998|nr:peptidoglycan-binding domain-containing protein [Alloactinosynnema sp. L-07]CRK60012.1 Peptidoglycan-binding domain 1 protein [Alloactinosynnema sp. L-07]
MTKRRRRAWVVAVMATAAGVLVGVGLWIAPSLKSPEQAAADAAAPPASLVTVAVERRALVEKVLLRGKVEAGVAIKVAPPVSGPTAVVTKVLVAPKDTLVEGKIAIEVAGEPVYPLVLPFPLYRDLVDGMTGPDVHEVQKALRRLGYPAPASGVFDVATQSSVRRMYLARGYRPAERAGATSGEATAPTPTSATPAPPKPTAQVVLPKSHVIRVDRVNRVVSLVPVVVGDVLGAGSPAAPPDGGGPSAPAPGSVLLELDAGQATVVATVGHDQISSLKPGGAAEVIDDVLGATSAATVQSIGTEPKQGADGVAGFDVRFSFAGTAMEPTPNHTVRITVGDATAAAPVLAVPVSAVYSMTDGTTFVTVDDHGKTSDHKVRTGTSAGGWVEIVSAPTELREGVLVVVGREST